MSSIDQNAPPLVYQVSEQVVPFFVGRNDILTKIMDRLMAPSQDGMSCSR